MMRQVFSHMDLFLGPFPLLPPPETKISKVKLNYSPCSCVLHGPKRRCLLRLLGLTPEVFPPRNAPSATHDQRTVDQLTVGSLRGSDDLTHKASFISQM